jgi:hypothetical protein
MEIYNPYRVVVPVVVVIVDIVAESATEKRRKDI